MPIYEYECRACSRGFEEFVRSAEAEAAVVCPYCKSKKVQKRLSVFAAHQGAGSSSGPAGMPPSCCGCSQAGSCAMQPEL